MQVRFHGFSLKSGRIPLDDFFSRLESKPADEFDYRGEARIVYVSKSTDYYVGLLLTAKDQRRFCELTSGKKDYKVNVRELKDKNRLVDFNFFIVNQQNGFGLFQHYRGSCGLSTFGHLLNHMYAEQLATQRDAAIQAIGGDLAPEADKKQLRGIYKTRLTFTPIYKSEDFDTLVSAMSRVRTVSFDCITLSKKEPLFTPTRAEIAKERHTISFVKKDGILGKIATAIKGIAKRTKYEEVAVTGNLTDGEPVTYHLDSNLDSFHKCEFDQIAEEKDLDVTDILKSSIVELMMSITRKHPEYFT